MHKGRRDRCLLFVLDTATPQTFIVSGPARAWKTYSFRIRKRGPFGLEQLRFGELGQGRIVGRSQNLVMTYKHCSGELAQGRFVGRSQILVTADGLLQTHRQRCSGTPTVQRAAPSGGRANPQEGTRQHSALPAAARPPGPAGVTPLKAPHPHLWSGASRVLSYLIIIA